MIRRLLDRGRREVGVACRESRDAALRSEEEQNTLPQAGHAAKAKRQVGICVRDGRMQGSVRAAERRLQKLRRAAMLRATTAISTGSGG